MKVKKYATLPLSLKKNIHSKKGYFLCDFTHLFLSKISIEKLNESKFTVVVVFHRFLVFHGCLLFHGWVLITTCITRLNSSLNQ